MSIPEYGEPIDSIELISFGYKYGFPEYATCLIDVRFLENPHYDSTLRALTGADQPVQEFIENQEVTAKFIAICTDLLRESLPRYFQFRDNYGKIVIAFGCTGGKHRSRYFAIKMQPIVEALLKEINIDIPVVVRHRDLGNE